MRRIDKLLRCEVFHRIVGFLPFFSLLAFLVICWQVSSRSIWIDEGMLLWNIWMTSDVLDYTQPLPFYNQAQPALISLFHHVVIHELTAEIEYIRVISAIVVFILSSLFIFVLLSEGANAVIVGLSWLAFAPQFAWYFTEIKHYSYEFAAVCIMLTIYTLHSTGKLKLWSGLIGCSLVAALGFSSIIPASVLCVLMILFDAHANGWKSLNKLNIFAVSISLFLIALIFFQMRILTSIQFENTDAYSTRGLLNDMRTLWGAGTSLLGWGLEWLISILCVLGLLSGRETLLFRFSVALTIIVAVVVIGRLTGLYPAFHARHLFWITPLMWAVVAIGLTHILRDKNDTACAILIFGVLLISLNVADLVRRQVQTNDWDRYDNNELYRTLAELEPSNVVLFPFARPTLDYYRILDERLSRHNYFYRRDITSGELGDIGARDGFYQLIDDMFENLPHGRFLYVVSHQSPLFADNGSRQSWRGSYVEEVIHDIGCSREELFSGRGAQLLALEC
jgi:hypothetical protein